MPSVYTAAIIEAVGAQALESLAQRGTRLSWRRISGNMIFREDITLVLHAGKHLLEHGILRDTKNRFTRSRI